MTRFKRLTVTMAAGLTLVAAGLVGTAGTAHADGDCGAAWNNVGSPANLYHYDNTISQYAYAGQVEQEYQNCGGGVVNARAHFQWSSWFQYEYSNSAVEVRIYATNSSDQGAEEGLTNRKDVYSDAVEIHHATPDAWQAQASLYGCNPGYAAGTYWYYGTGSDWGTPSTGYC
jgi:hypothetical protein